MLREFRENRHKPFRRNMSVRVAQRTSANNCRKKRHNLAARPHLKLVGEDGNAFSIIGRAIKVAKRENWSAERIKQFRDEAMAGDYDNVLATCEKWFKCD
jgi:hypothetical protein